MYYTYILFSESIDRYYIGSCADIEKRLHSHNTKQNRFTKKGVPWRLVFSKEFDNKSDAIKFENYIKRMKSRQYIEKLIRVG